jgi:hypothetical protein
MSAIENRYNQVKKAEQKLNAQPHCKIAIEKC